MLIIKRKVDEGIVIDGNVKIKILKTTKKNVTLGLEIPDDVSVMRKDLRGNTFVAGSAVDLINSMKESALKEASAADAAIDFINSTKESTPPPPDTTAHKPQAIYFRRS